MASFTLHINHPSVFSEHRLLQGLCGPTCGPESRTDSVRPSVTRMISVGTDPKRVLREGESPCESLPVVLEKQREPPQ